MTFLTLRVLVSLYSKVIVDQPNIILAFQGVVPLKVGSRELIPCGFAPSWYQSFVLESGFYLNT